MRCPKCLHDDTKVLESRVSHEGRSVRRRRNCSKCQYRFTTYEKQEELQLQVEKKNKSFQPFSRTKLVKAIQAACIKRPVSVSVIESVVARIERALQEKGDRVVPSEQIGDMTMFQLKDIDHVAYVRFASIYKDFKDPAEFSMEIEGLGSQEHPHVHGPN